jgi:hypothetical protein
VSKGRHGCVAAFELTIDVPVCAKNSGDRHREHVTTPRHCTNDLLRIVIQGLSDVCDALGQRFVGHDNVRPDRAQQFFAGDETARPLGKIAENLKRFWPKLDFARSSRQTLGGQIERHVEK